jgi:hypothetical protein
MVKIKVVLEFESDFVGLESAIKTSLIDSIKKDFLESHEKVTLKELEVLNG